MRWFNSLPPWILEWFWALPVDCASFYWEINAVDCFLKASRRGRNWQCWWYLVFFFRRTGPLPFMKDWTGTLTQSSRTKQLQSSGVEMDGYPSRLQRNGHLWRCVFWFLKMLILQYLCFIGRTEFLIQWQVYGLDINPRAIKISWINLYFNALDDNGEPIYDTAKKTLLDRVEFHESDLLSYCRDNHIELERIVGCIPQVLTV